MTRARTLSLTRLGWGLALPVAFLALIGLAAIHATDRFDDSDLVIAPEEINWTYQLQREIGADTLSHATRLLTGVGLMLLVLAPGYRRIGALAVPIYWIIIALLAILVVDAYIDLPFVRVIRKIRGWLDLGIVRIQPAEFAKLSLVLVLAHYLRFRDSYRRWSGLVPPFLLTLLPMALIAKQPDLGTLVMLLPVLFAMLFVAGARGRHLATIVVIGLALLPLFYMYGMKEYQRDRVRALFRQNSDDERWQRSEGYQLRQGLTALGSGGAWGEGWRQGVFVRYALLPEEKNDFIFAIVGNQWGLLGCALVILAYVVIVVCGLEVALVTRDPFGRLLAVGIVVMIAAQAMLNICTNIGLAPITGITLPFVSFGGSSLWVNFLGLGLILSIAQRRPLWLSRRPFEHAD